MARKLAALVWMTTSLAASIAAPARAAPAAGAPAPGVYWEQAVELQMAGFSMPGQTVKVCLPKGAWKDPPQSDSRCKVTDLRKNGARMQWKVACADGTTGKGDITQGADSYTGTMEMRREGTDLRMKVKGRQLGGDCDAGRTQRQADALRGLAEESEARVERGEAHCEDAVQDMDLSAIVGFDGLPPPCAGHKAHFCARLETIEGFVEAKHPTKETRDARAEAAALCEKDVAALQGRLCVEAAEEPPVGRERAPAAEQLIVELCPAQLDAIAKARCAGRAYLELPAREREYCVRFASGELRGVVRPEVERKPAEAQRQLIQQIKRR